VATQTVRGPALVILGAGESQVPAYREACRLGRRVIGVDRRPDAPASGLCDQFLCVSTTDAAAIADRLEGMAIAGVIAPATNPAIPTQRALSLLHGTPYRTSAAAVLASVDKSRFRELVDDLGLPGYRWVSGRGGARVAAAAAGLRFPVVVKPVDGAGSRGISTPDRPDQLGPAILHALDWSPAGRVIVEELVPGRHCSAEVFLEDGQAVVLGISERTVTGPPAFVTIAHLMPAALDPAAARRVRKLVETTCAAVGLRRGPVNFDLVAGDDGEVYLIEMGARLGGNGLDRLVSRTLGVNLVRAALELAVGGRPRPRPRPRRRGTGMVYALHSPHAGVLTAIEGLDAARSVPGLVELEIHAALGAAVLPYDQGSRKLGYLTLVAPTAAEVRGALDEVLGRLRLEVTPGEPGTDGRAPAGQGGATR
jgi:biotin carboxylase